MIVLKNGDDIQAKVLDVTQDEITYKKHSNPDGPTYTMDKDFVFFIKYANGEKDVFSASPSETATPAPLTKPVKATEEMKNKPEVKKGHFFTAIGVQFAFRF